MKEYNVTITDASKELTAREKIKLKHLNGVPKLIDLCLEKPYAFSPKDWFLLNIHNEKVRRKDGNTDYQILIVEDIDGNMYSTSSTSFYETFTDIFSDMKELVEETGEAYEVEAYQFPSKNYEGNNILSCRLID